MARIAGKSKVGVRTLTKSTVFLDDEIKARARVLGNGNVSAGIREAVMQASVTQPHVNYGSHGKPVSVVFPDGSIYNLTPTEYVRP